MAPTILHLPNVATVTVSPVFAGLSFKANDLNTHHSIFPPGWTIILESEDETDDKDRTSSPEAEDDGQIHIAKRGRAHRFKTPTLRNDNLFLSSISNPSSIDFKPATSPTRQIAMMLWVTLFWYFHQTPPNPHLSTGVYSKLPEKGRPKGPWRVNIKREGIFKGRHLLPKLERMGLISSEDSSVGSSSDDRSGHGWTEMFVSQRSFWQIDARIYLFTLSPTMPSPFPGGSSPHPSRPGSPNREGVGNMSPRPDHHGELSQGLWSPAITGPFASSSHLPTYYPPPPPQYIFTSSIKHPIRPKPPAQGETFYTRYIPSVEQYLSFRVASSSTKSPPYRSQYPNTTPCFLPPKSVLASSSGITQSTGNLGIQPCDTDLLHTWMNDPRVSVAWGVSGPRKVQEEFLNQGLNSKHSFPVIGCWDGKPFGYFEIYWAKEDHLGRHLINKDVSDWDRGFHALVGEQEFRGKHRVKIWASALVHYCWLADPRTEKVLVEPRADNEKFISYLQDVGFYKEREITFPHKQAALMKLVREAWDAPAL